MCPQWTLWLGECLPLHKYCILVTFSSFWKYRNKRSIAVNLKHRAGIKIVQDLCCDADILIEPYRPGVMEKLGLGPQHCLGLNPRLVYARLTGFGQRGPLAHRAGHDINFLAISGVLSVSIMIYTCA